jgi:hypothetical protein
MKTKKINDKNFKYYNSKFNGSIENLIKNIFQTEDEGEIGYQLSSEENLKNDRNKIIIDERIERIDLLETPDVHLISKKIILNTNELGYLEMKMLENIIMNSYTTTIITGALGSGKTAIIKYILNYIDRNYKHENCEHFENCFFKKHYNIYINFNEYGDNDLKSEKIAEIKDNIINDLFVKLTPPIEEILINMRIFDFVEDVISKDINYIYKKYNLYDNFDTKRIIKNIKAEYFFFKNKYIDLSSFNWKSQTIEYKVNVFLNWINDNAINIYSKLANYSNLLRLIGVLHPSKRSSCFVIVFDNIDGLIDELQYDLLDLIWRFVEKTFLTILLPLRLTTFAKVPSGKTFSFRVFEHGSNLVSSIVLKRLKYYINNQDIFKEAIKTINSKNIEIINGRINHIISLLSKDDDRLKDTIDALSGHSIRRGLFLSERMFLNSTIINTDISPNHDTLIKSLFIGLKSNNEMDKKDGLVHNIFANHENNNSLLNIRILQFLKFNFRSNKITTLSSLIKELNRFNVYSMNDILFSINDLINVSKRLIFVDGKSTFLNTSDLINNNESFISITKTGLNYFENMTTNLQYMQSCFESIEWQTKFLKRTALLVNKILFSDENFVNRLKKEPAIKQILDDLLNHNFRTSDIIPLEYNNSNINDRFSFIRKGLHLLLINDIVQLLYLKYYDLMDYNLDSDDDSNNEVKIFNNNLIVNTFIRNAAHSFTNILISEKNNNKILIIEEVKNWYNLVFISSLWEEVLTEKTQNKTDSLYHKFETIINEN